MRARGSIAAAAVLVATLSLPARRAHADEDDLPDVQALQMRFEEKNRIIQTTIRFPQIVDKELAKKLDSGFATNIVLRAYVYKEKGGDTPIALSVVTFKIAYDLWDEVYLVQIRDPRGELNLRRATKAEAIRDITAIANLPLVPSALLPIGSNHFLAVIIEVNPVSEELLAEVRRWLSRPNRSRLGGADAFFGSFVSIFVNRKMAHADRVLRYRSQPFYRPKPKVKPATPAGGAR